MNIFGDYNVLLTASSGYHKLHSHRFVQLLPVMEKEKRNLSQWEIEKEFECKIRSIQFSISGHSSLGLSPAETLKDGDVVVDIELDTDVIKVAKTSIPVLF